MRQTRGQHILAQLQIERKMSDAKWVSEKIFYDCKIETNPKEQQKQLYHNSINRQLACISNLPIASTLVRNTCTHPFSRQHIQKVPLEYLACAFTKVQHKLKNAIIVWIYWLKFYSHSTIVTLLNKCIMQNAH